MQPKESANGLYHELYHVFDASRAISLATGADAEWLALNPAGFSYRGYDAFFGPEAQTRNVYAERTPKGFISMYATASEAEDKAELYSSMMNFPNVVAKAIGSDQHLRAKVELIERRMRLLGPEYVAGFWRSRQP